jgi:hypothetical protein
VDGGDRRSLGRPRNVRPRFTRRVAAYATLQLETFEEALRSKPAQSGRPSCFARASCLIFSKDALSSKSVDDTRRVEAPPGEDAGQAPAGNVAARPSTQVVLISDLQSESRSRSQGMGNERLGHDFLSMGHTAEYVRSIHSGIKVDIVS